MDERREDGLGAAAGIGLTVVLVAATLGVAALAALVGMIARARGFADAFAAVRLDPLLVGLAQLGGASVAIALGVIWTRREAPLREALGVTPVSSAIAVLALSAGLALAFPLREIANLVADLVPALAPDPAAVRAAARQLHVGSLRDAIVVPLALVAVPALAEELFFRGLLLPGLAKRHGPRVALGLSAVLFGLIHGSPLAILVGTLAGLVLGWLRLRVRSVLPCVALHGAFNAVPVLLPPQLIRLRGFNTLELEHVSLPLALGGALVAAACLALVARFADDEP
ncbi:MAG: CPBP family intramembrane metalloprotease [Sandaracinaceae bacterium]|nr:CPBP family intramembrane metalloprotease [Sandaracinaceae bacterium]